MIKMYNDKNELVYSGLNYVLKGVTNGYIPLKKFRLVGYKRILSEFFQPITLIYRRGNLIHNHWGCISISHSLSYPLKFLPLFYKPTPFPHQQPVYVKKIHSRTRK